MSTLSTLTNVQNSLFIPDLGRYVNRRPTFTLTRLPEAQTQTEAERPPEGRPPIPGEPTPEELEGMDEEQKIEARRQRLTSITSRMDDSHFAVLPHGERLEGWSQEDIAEMNDHVRHMLHSRREKFKRGMRGFGQYVRKRECKYMVLKKRLTDLWHSPRLLRYALRGSYHSLRSCVGVVLNWYVYSALRRWSTNLIIIQAGLMLVDAKTTLLMSSTTFSWHSLL